MMIPTSSWLHPEHRLNSAAKHHGALGAMRKAGNGLAGGGVDN
jgi:hypothetical protein